jgi:hypothetical protein
MPNRHLRLTPPARRASAKLAALFGLVVLGGCHHYESRALGPGGMRVSSVPEGAAVDVRFASPRTFRGSSGLDRVVRVRGSVDRTSGDTLFVRVGEAAPLGSGLRAVDPAVRVPVVVTRDTAVRVRELSRSRTILTAAGALLAALVLVAAS